MIPVDDACICPLSGIVMRGSFCSPRKCDRCGWNPKVHAERVAKLQRYGPHALQPQSPTTKPEADVKPVRHGHWIKRGYVCGENEYECSECHETEWRTSDSRMKWCMFCGAKMDGGSDNGKMGRI